MNTSSRGSEWRQWDLHIHSPASFEWKGERLESAHHKNDAVISDMVGALNSASPAVFCLMDYWSFDGWLALQRHTTAHKLLKKTVFPGIELRLAAPTKTRLNAHAIFSNECEEQHLLDFLSQLELELVGRPLSRTSIIEYARALTPDKLKKIGTTRKEVNASDDEAYRVGCRTAEVNADSYKRAISKFPEGMVLGFMPFSTSDGLEKIGWDDNYAYAMGMFKSSLIFETRDVDQWAAFSGVKTKKNSPWLADFTEALGGVPRLAVSGSDAHMFRGNGTNDARGYGDFPSGKKTWIKADPTWRGLLQAVKEPAKRSFIGDEPPKLKHVRQHKTYYIDKVRIEKVKQSDLADNWFDGTELALNPELVAIIGNKGSGKSALADIIALAGRSRHVDKFSFLRPGRFRGKSGSPARHFIGYIDWCGGGPTEANLAVDPDRSAVELVRYVPQGRFEGLCNDHVSGDVDPLEAELRSVIFSHVPDHVRLGAMSFDQLAETQDLLFKAKVGDLRRSLHEVSEQIMLTEDQLHPSIRRSLERQVEVKELQLREHESLRPVPPSSGEHRSIEELKAANAALGGLDEALMKAVEKQKALTVKRRSLSEKAQAERRLSGRLTLLAKQVASTLRDASTDAGILGLAVSDVVRFDVDLEPLEQIRHRNDTDLASVESEIKASAEKLEDLTAARAAEVDKLNEPERLLQAHIRQVAEWERALASIVGADSEPETLNGLRGRLAQLDQLPERLTKLRSKRREIAEEIFEALQQLRASREQLFAPVQQLVSQNPLIGSEYRLRFEARLAASSRSIAASLFDFIKRSKGELRGEEESEAAVRARFEKCDFKTSDDAVAFADSIVELLHTATTESIDGPGIRGLVKKGASPTDVYDFLYGFGYLESKYTLTFQGVSIEQLSPGQRGALLLIFYLLVDQGRNPIVIDQPEENLDNETVVQLLVPVLNEARKTRQIVVVTHSPNLAVVCDAEQIILASFDRSSSPRIEYTSGSIEDQLLNRAVVNVLEGTKVAFDNRGGKYY